MTAKTTITEYPNYFMVTGSPLLENCDLVTDHPVGVIQRLKEAAIHTQDWKELVKNKSAILRTTVGVGLKAIYEMFFCLGHGILGKLAVLSVLTLVSEEASNFWKKLEPLFEWGLPVVLIVSAGVTVKRTKVIANAVVNIDERNIEIKSTRSVECNHEQSSLSEWKSAFKGRTNLLYKPPMERRLPRIHT